ncbi:hypothetical protein V2J09_003236 [Rumex salicifolius]
MPKYCIALYLLKLESAQLGCRFIAKGMHGVSSGCSLLVNAEVDSMGGVIDSEDGIGTKTSPQQVAIEIAQAELRLEYDVREERRRELEFLEKGGNPLDFRFALAASLSIQSTSVADQIHDQFVTSEAKGGFAVANSSRGDSVESNGILGATLPCEPNSADNFDGGNELVEHEERAIYPGRASIAPSEHSSQVDGSQNVRESEGSPSFQPNKAYKRRNRSKPNRDTARISSTDIASHGTPSSSLPSCAVVVPKAVVHEPLSDTEVDAANAVTMNPSYGCFSEGKVGMSTSRDLKDGLPIQDTNDDGVPDAISSRQPDSFMEREETIPAFGECVPCSGSEKPEDDTVMKQLSEPNRLHPDGKCLQSEDVVNNAAFISKGLDSDSSCTQTSFSIEANGNMDSDLCNSLKNIASKGDGIEQKVRIDQTTMSKDETELDDRIVTCTTESKSCLKDNHETFQANSYRGKDEEETKKRSSEHEAKSQHMFEDKQSNQLTNNIADRNQGLSTALNSESERCCLEKPQGPHDPYTNELNKASTSEPVAIETLPPAGNQTEVVDKAHEDRILEEAKIIEVKRERINELSIGPPPKEYRRKSHWDFVLEEMAWMANDFAQERLWKRTTSSQLCQRAAFASRVKLEEQIKQRKDKTVAQTLARAVMEFWRSAGSCLVQSGIISGFEACGDGKMDSENKYHYRGLDEEPGGENIKLALQQYVARFMKHNSSVVSSANIEAFGTSEREFCTDMPEMASLDQRIEEDLFYVVPHGAMEAYRKSIEIYTVQCEKAGKTMLEDADTSMNNSFAEFASQENEYEEDEGESVYQFSGAFGGRKQPKFIQKRGRNTKSYIPKSYEMDYDHCTENRISTPQSVVGKRPPNGLNVGSIPTKRVRTASRQRVLGPTMGGAGFIPVPRRTDASSGDTNSFQDDQATVHGGSFVPRGLEVESRMDFDKQLTYDSSETTVKHKKKKKNKYQGETYDRRWQVDANMQGEQKEHLKRRMEYHQYESSGNGGLLSHAKKLKIMKHSMDNSFENTNLMSGSVPSPVGSQMSNMSKQNKLIKLISGRDRGRKAKALKMPSGQPGSGSPWSLFEDQALVVLVHDMGPNWELVSDAINSTLYFKCIFRKPKECKERHKVLIEKSCADGADSADDSGCSQPYPSTLPGIPKALILFYYYNILGNRAVEGGARQLFQQLRGPIEEDTIKSHFEKIILLGQLLHGRKKQEPKQLVPVHGSHASALLQVIPNNVNGGVLTPLDLCDMIASSPDVFSINYQSPHSGGGLPLANQGIAQPMHSSSGTNSLLQCPPGMGHASNLSAPSGQLSSPASVGRYGVQRTSLPVNEQHRVQQYNHMLSARNTHQTNTPVSGAFSGGDRNMRVLPGGNGMVMPGMSRSMSIPRPNLQGISSSPLLNSANSGSPNVASIPMHSGASPGQGNITPQPRDALHMVRTGQNSEHPRQIMPPEMQLQATQASSQGVASFGGPSSTFLNHPASPSVPSYPVHKGTAEQQALAVRIARERQLQHRIMQRQQQQQQQQQQFPHHPLQNGLQNNSHMQSQASPITPVSVSSQQQLKHLNGVGGAMNQRQRPPGQQLQPQFQQSATARHHPPQKPKGFGKGNMSMHQPAVTQGSLMEKGERDIHPTPSPASSVPTPNQSMLPSRNHQQLRVHPVKSVNNSQPTVQRTVSQNCVSEADQLAKRQYDPSRADLPLANTTSNSNEAARFLFYEGVMGMMTQVECLC